ncbi:MAG: N-acetylmuramoyl-L-alanine amidase [Bacteroidetes bacterium]|nr:N-acetylmuramoyl-L-alanine amidase [Bacteroidota bacterium]
MKKLLLFFSAALCTTFSYSTEVVPNTYSNYFNAAYQQYPTIPKGILEAVAFTNTHFQHITHTSTASESCAGIPNAYGVMGLTLDGQDYFYDNLVLVSQLSGYSVEDIINSPQTNILAYADAFDSLMVNMSISGNNMKDYIPVLTMLSELPSGTIGQQFAMNAQLYSIMEFMDNADYQQAYGFPDRNIDYTAIFGADNYSILSSQSITVTDESVFNKNGLYFTPNINRSPMSADYGPALWTAAASCNYSSRSGVAVSAVTIHTVQGSYAGCISWFQNCAASVSAHYVLKSSNGQVTQMVLESNKAWHVGSENPYTIGLEHEGYISDATWYTNAMYVSSADLVRDITNSGYGINPLRTYYGPGCSGGYSNCLLGGCTKIKGHQMYNNQTHTDPGPNWNWAKYYLLINNNPSITTVTNATGNFYDSGGAGSNYTDDERILTLIQPAGATSITLNFTSFNTELNWDYLFIYDGANTSAPLIGQYTGTNSPGVVTSSGGSLLLEFRSDCATIAPGWVANYTSNISTPAPTDNIAPTTLVSNPNIWETANFTASFTDADNVGGSGLEKSYYQVIDFNGTEWRANANNGFFADNFDLAIHPDWTSAQGTWSINNASLYQSDEANGNTNIYASLNQSLSNRYLYNFYGKIDGAGTTRRAGFHFFCDNGSATNRGNSYFVWFRVDDAKLQIYKVVNDVFGAPVVDTAFTTVAGQWYDYKVIYDRITGKISIYRDNAYITSWTDSSPIATGNAISFRSGNANFAINELKVYRSRLPNTANITVGAAATNDIRYQNPNPTTFSAKVKSICADSAKNLSSIFYQNINIDWTPPSAVDTINDGTAADIAITYSATDLSANWSSSVDTNSAIARYWYAIGTTPGATDVVNWIDNWFNRSVTHTGLSLVDGQMYYFSVKAENGAGLQSSVFTSNGQLVELTPTSVSESTNTFELNVYPNPFTNNTSLSYQLSASADVRIELVDVLGKQIELLNTRAQAAGKHAITINASELQLAKGMYFFKLQVNDVVETKKVVIK